MYSIYMNAHTVRWTGCLCGQTLYMSSKTVPGSLLSFVLSHLHVWLTVTSFDWKQNTPGLDFTAQNTLTLTRRWCLSWESTLLTVSVSLPVLGDELWWHIYACFWVKFLCSNFSDGHILWQTKQYLYISAALLFPVSDAYKVLNVLINATVLFQGEKLFW